MIHFNSSIFSQAISVRTAAKSALVARSPWLASPKASAKASACSEVKCPFPQDAGEPECIEQKRVHGGTMRRRAAKVQLRPRGSKRWPISPLGGRGLYSRAQMCGCRLVTPPSDRPRSATTRNGQPIDLYDNLGIQNRPATTRPRSSKLAGRPRARSACVTCGSRKTRRSPASRRTARGSRGASAMSAPRRLPAPPGPSCSIARRHEVIGPCIQYLRTRLTSLP
jgi:hypothetical protein